MTLFVGVISTDDAWSPENLAKKLANAACRYDSLNTIPIICDTKLACFAIQRSEGNSPIVVQKTATETRVFISDVVARSKSQAQLANALLSNPESATQDITGPWLALFYKHNDRSLGLLCDKLGVAWLYIAPFEHGYMFSSDFGALVSNYPGDLQVSEEGMLSTLALGYVPNDGTCFEQISILPAGTMMEVGPKEAKKVWQIPREYGDKFANISVEKKFNKLDAAFEASIDGWCGDGCTDSVISLSGGYDSRYGLGYLRNRGIDGRCVTFGNPRSVDAQVARAICEQQKIDWQLYGIEEASREGWQRCIEQVGSVGGFHWSDWEKWLSVLKKNGQRVVIGYLGDALSGKHLETQAGGADQDWLDNWEHSSLEEGWLNSVLLRDNAKERMTEVIREGFRTLIDNTEFAFPYQMAMHLDWYGRQRRYVASQPNLMSRFIEPISFFYSPALLDFWANVSYEDVNAQNLYLSFGRKRFPMLFEKDRRPTLRERLLGSAKNLAIDIVPQWKNWLAPSEIDQKAILKQNSNWITELFNDVAPLFEEVLDTKATARELELVPNSKCLGSVQALRLINLCILLRLSIRPGPSF